MTNIRALFLIIVALRAAAAPHAAQHPAMPPGMTHEEHLAQMEKERQLKERGAAAMGFDQNAATHHFRLLPTGGTIQVTANDAADEGTRSLIRTHLREIVTLFAAGDFAKPLATHGEVPPGVTAMQDNRSVLRFTYDEIASGAIVRIDAGNAAALSGVHEFLRYQIQEHRTGDPLTVAK